MEDLSYLNTEYARNKMVESRQLEAKDHEHQELIAYIEYQAEMIISYIADKRLCTDHLMDKIESCVQQIMESVEAIR